jgi:hypothetical protein
VATVDEHLDQFEHNLEVARRLAGTDDNWDWALTALFYAALHLCQAYMSRQGLQADSHRKRERQMLASSELQPVLNHYKALRNDSEEARYDCRQFSRSEFESIRDGTFSTVSGHLRSLLGVS